MGFFRWVLTRQCYQRCRNMSHLRKISQCLREVLHPHLPHQWLCTWASCRRRAVHIRVHLHATIFLHEHKTIRRLYPNVTPK